MKYAVIGTGYWGSNHVRVGAELADEGSVDEVVLCDVDESRVADLADTYDVSYTTDFSSLDDLQVDAATIATPSPTHHKIATELMEAGIDVLVEKPLATNSDDAWDIVDVAERENRTLAVGHIFRHHPALDELKRRIERGEFGRLKYLNTTRFSFRVPRSTVGALYSLAIHDVDISNYLLDEEPETVYCNLDSVVRDDIDETAMITMEYGEATSVINESWQVPVFGKRRDLVVVGSEKAGYIDYLQDNVLEVYDSRVVTQDSGLTAQQEGKQTYEVADEEPLRGEVEDFFSARTSNSDPKAPGVIGAKAVELLEHLEESATSGETIDIGTE